jgi:hypothetical protein
MHCNGQLVSEHDKQYDEFQLLFSLFSTFFSLFFK